MSYVLHCGDCLEYMRGMDAGSVDAVITDPPYGISLDTDYSRFNDSSKGVVGYSYLRKSHSKVIGDDRPFDPAMWISFDKVILWGANNFASNIPNGTWLVWDKRADNGHALMSDAEIGWYSKGRGVYIFDHCWHGFARSSENSEHYHPTQKPVALMRWCIEMCTNKGDTVFDPFMGSGTTGVACMQLGRNFIGCEIDPAYFAIAQRRIADAAAQPMLPGLTVTTPRPEQSTMEFDE